MKFLSIALMVLGAIAVFFGLYYHSPILGVGGFLATWGGELLPRTNASAPPPPRTQTEVRKTHSARNRA